MKKFAFTLAEIMLSMMVIGILSIIMLRNIKPQNFTEKSYVASANKLVSLYQDATLKIQEFDSNVCPNGKLMTKIGNDWHITLYNADKEEIDAQEMIELYGNFIKFESDSFEFCDNTTYCSDDSIIGARLPGNMYLGFEVLDSIGDCPSYYLPGNETINPAPTVFNVVSGEQETAQCWAKYYIDVDGKKGPNALGKDVFVFGIDDKGLAI